MPQSTQKASDGKAGSKPVKPYPDFPLFPHATGRWAKKIRGKLLYYGKWRGVPDDGWQAALETYQQYRDDDHSGRARRTVGAGGLTLRELVNRFLTAKEQLRDSGDIVARTFNDYHDVCERTIKYFGADRLIDDIVAEDFGAFRSAISKTRGPVALTNDITRVRVLFKWGFDAGVLDKPIRYGQSFQKPSKAVLRKVKAARGARLFSAKDIQGMLDKASVPLKAMILLGINCGFGNQDCAMLPKSAIEFASGWIDYPRPKTGIDRRCPLWKETIKALKAAIAARPKPKDPANDGLAFITSRAKTWAKDVDDNPVSKETTKVLKDLGIHRAGLGFYSLRHTFQTIGDGGRDHSAVQHIMGHAPSQNDMGAVYRESIPDERLKAVTDHVHSWLYPPTPTRKDKAPAKRKAPAKNH